MLAGNMKLKTFLGIGCAALVVGVGGLAAAAYLFTPEFEPEPVWVPSAPAANPSPAPSGGEESGPAQMGEPGAEQVAPSGALGVETAYAILPVHGWLVSQAGRDLGTDKVQDATRGQRYKVNLYQDDGNAVMNRAKIDHDRDDQWDEKWTFDPDGRITIQVSPADDEEYLERYVWNGQGWDND